MASISKDSTNHVWMFTDIIESNTYNVVFDTLNKFLDAKIKATLTVQSGKINKPTIVPNNLLTYFTADGTASSNDMTLRPQVTNTSGFIAAHTSASPVLGDVEYYNIIHGEGEKNTANVVISNTDGSNNGTNISSIVGTVADTEPTSGYYLSFTGSGSSKIKTDGWMTAGTTLPAASKTRYFPIQTATITASCTNATATTTVAPGTVSIAKNGTTTVNGKTQILATVDPATATSGISTYFIAIKASAAANTSGTTSSITGTNTASVSTEGYAPTTLTGTGTISGTATAKTSKKDSSVYYIPVPTAGYTSNSASAEITKTTTDSSSTGGINVGAILGNKANAEPSDGYYISLQASGSGSSKITTAGWLPEDQTLTAASTTVERFFPVTAAVLAVSKTGGSITPTVSLSKSNTVTWSTSNTSGVSITGTGNGSVSNLAIKANVSTAGYIPTGDVATASNLTIAAASTAATETKYITGVTITSGKSFTVTNSGTTTVTAGISGSTTQGTIKITAYPSSGTTADAVQTIVNNGRWAEKTISAANTWYYGKVKAGALTVTTSADTGNLSTYFNTGTSSDNNVTITPKYTNTVGFKTALTTATNNGGTTYWKIKTTSVTQNDSTVTTSNNTTTVTRASASWGTGWISSGSISPAVFGNEPADGKTHASYKDISNTDDVPVLISGSGLYINKGYVDNLYINLAKLVPDTLTDDKIFAPANYILTGYAAFNADGTQISGTMPKYNGEYTTNVS